MTCAKKTHLGKINKIDASCQYHMYQLGNAIYRIHCINVNIVYSVNVIIMLPTNIFVSGFTHPLGLAFASTSQYFGVTFLKAVFGVPISNAVTMKPPQTR